MFAWGMVATFSAFVQNLAGLIACRLLLGLFEAGLFPGVLIYLTIFYPKKNIGIRTAFFYSMAAVSGACGGLIAYGIGNIDGAGGWRGWRWIVLVNGIPTILTAFVLPFILPNSIETAKFLTLEQRTFMAKLREQEVGHTKNSQKLHWDDVKAGLLDWKSWLFGVCQFCINTMAYSFAVFLPTIIRDIGSWSNSQVQALTVPVYALGFCTYLTTAWLSDRYQRRGLPVIVAQVTCIVGYCLLTPNYTVVMSFIGCFIIGAGVFTSAGSTLVWINSNNPRWGKRAVASGLQLTVGNLAGVSAPFVFSNRDAPTYFPGYGATMGLLVLSVCLHTFVYFYWRRGNARKLSGKEDWRMEGLSEEQIAELGEHNPRYIYTL